MVLVLPEFTMSTSHVPVRNDPEAASNTPQCFWNTPTLLTTCMFRLYKCTCANIEVGMVAKLRR